MSNGAAASSRLDQASAVEQAAQPRPRLVFFHSKFDGRCRRVEGYLAQVLQRRGNHGTFVLRQVDVDERPDLVGRFRIEDVPTLLVVAENRVQGRLAPKGCRDIEAMLRDIEAMLKPWLH